MFRIGWSYVPFMFMILHMYVISILWTGRQSCSELNFFIRDRCCLLFLFFFLISVFHSNIALVPFMPGAHDRSKKWVQICLGIFLTELNHGFNLQPHCDFYSRETKIPIPTCTRVHKYSVFSHRGTFIEKEKVKKKFK